MPFGKWENFGECEKEMNQKYDTETAKKVCGKLKAKLEGDDMSEISDGDVKFITKNGKRIPIHEEGGGKGIAPFYGKEKGPLTPGGITSYSKQPDISNVMMNSKDPKTRSYAAKFSNNIKELEYLSVSDKSQAVRFSAWGQLRELGRKDPKAQKTYERVKTQFEKEGWSFGKGHATKTTQKKEELKPIKSKNDLGYITAKSIREPQSQTGYGELGKYFKKRGMLDDYESVLNPMDIRAFTKVYVDEPCIQKFIGLGFTRKQAIIICSAKKIDSEFEDTKLSRQFEWKKGTKTYYKSKEEQKKTELESPPSVSKVAKEKKQKEKKLEERKQAPETRRKYGTLKIGEKAEVQTKTQFSPEKRGAMSLPLQIPMRPPKSQHKLQVKLERMQTEEEKFLTQEQLARRATYARVVKKRDSEDFESEQTIAFVSGDSEMGNYNVLNNVIRVPVILAREMIQPYYKKDADGNRVEIKHFKPYEELAKGIKGVDSIPMIIEHKKWVDDDVIGMVKDLWADDKDRSIKGMAYITASKIPESLRTTIESKIRVPVSIGFWADLGPGGTWAGRLYDAVQKNIILDHLAIIINSNARCSVFDGCGLNMDSVESSDNLENFIFKDSLNYYIINSLNNLTLEDKSENIDKVKNGEQQIMEQDAEFPLDAIKEKLREQFGDDIPTNLLLIGEEGELITYDDVFGEPPPVGQRHEVSGTGDDLNAILERLWKFLGGIASAEAKAEAMNRIRNAFKGDSEMDEKEFEQAIELKDAEIEKLKADMSKLSDSVKEYEEKEKANLIDSIKKFAKYEDAELADKCTKELRIIADAVTRFEPSGKKPKVLPKQIEDSDLTPRLNPSDMWKETNKVFKDRHL